MLKKTIEFKDLDDNSVKRDFYFHMFPANLAKLKLELVGDGDGKEGMDNKIKQMLKAKDVAGIIGMFDRILELSYGVKDDDNIGFLQGPEYFRKFQATDAYSVLFMELIGDPVKATAFIRGCLPKDISDKMAPNQSLDQVLAELDVAPAVLDKVSNVEVGLGGGLPHMPATSVVQPREAKDYSEQELMDMSWDDFHKLFGKNVVAWDQDTMVIATNRKLKGK